MILYIIPICVLILVPSKLQLHGINDTYLSKERCNTVKGIFILLIFASHFANTYTKNYTGLLDTLYWRIREALGQCVVAPFLFYSGYGVMLSAARKGTNYMNSFPRKRILHTLLVYNCSQIFFLIFQLWRGQTYNLKQFISAFLAWSSFGNDNWYIFVILGLYMISWLALRNGQPNRARVMKITVGILGFMLFLICAGKGTYWYNSALCYAFGAWYFVYQEKIEAFLRKDVNYFVVIGLTMLSYVVAHKFWRYKFAAYVLTILLFTAVVVFATMKFQVKNRFLNYCGEHLQGLFLLHRLPMKFLENYPFFQNNLYIFFATMVLFTFLLEFGFDQLLRSMKTTNREPI